MQNYVLTGAPPPQPKIFHFIITCFRMDVAGGKVGHLLLRLSAQVACQLVISPLRFPTLVFAYVHSTCRGNKEETEKNDNAS